MQNRAVGAVGVAFETPFAHGKNRLWGKSEFLRDPVDTPTARPCAQTSRKVDPTLQNRAVGAVGVAFETRLPLKKTISQTFQSEFSRLANLYQSRVDTTNYY